MFERLMLLTASKVSTLAGKSALRVFRTTEFTATSRVQGDMIITAQGLKHMERIDAGSMLNSYEVRYNLFNESGQKTEIHRTMQVSSTRYQNS